MERYYATNNPDGGVSITHVVKDTEAEITAALAKTVFELSRTSDLITPFDPSAHTLDAIAQGIAGHRPLTPHDIERSDLPADRYFRDAWEWSN